MTDEKRERIAKYLLEIFRSIWCDRESDLWPYFNCLVCEFKDGDECILKQFIMTRDEAINTLANFKVYISGGGVTDKKANEALDMAIEALSERPKVSG